MFPISLISPPISPVGRTYVVPSSNFSEKGIMKINQTADEISTLSVFLPGISHSCIINIVMSFLHNSVVESLFNAKGPRFNPEQGIVFITDS